MAIQLAAILAVLEAIGKVASAINGIYDFVKNADEFFGGASDWDQVRVVISAQIVSRNQILQVSGAILDAVVQLDRRIFLERIADRLGDSDQAVLALDTWKRTGDLNQSAIALNESAGALSDVLRYSNNNVYPNESLVFPLIEILVTRLVILKEADADFVRSPISRRPIEEAIQLIRLTSDSIESAVQQANVIRENNVITTRVRVRPPEEGGGRETVRVLRLSMSYRNIDGSVTFERHGEFEPEDGAPDGIIQQARADAAPVRQRGLALDLERARVSMLRETADVAERCLLVSEARWISGKFWRREPTNLEMAYYVARRQRARFDEAALTLIEHLSVDVDKDSLAALVAQVRGRQVDEEAKASLWKVSQALGTKAVLRLLLSDEPDEAAFRPQPGTTIE